MAAPLVSFAPPLPKFGGAPDEDCAQFLSRLDRLFGLYANMTAEHKLFYVENCCHGSAQTVVSRRLREIEADRPVVGPEAQYESVRTALTAAFPTILDKQNLRDQLQTRIKKESESYAQYAQDILRLCQKIGIVDVAEQLQEVHKGVDLSVAAALRPGDYQSVDAFLRAVHALEMTHRAAVRAHTQHNLQNHLPPPVLATPAPTSTAAPSTAAPSAAAVLQASALPLTPGPAAPQPHGTGWDELLQQLIGRIDKLADVTVNAVQSMPHLQQPDFEEPDFDSPIDKHGQWLARQTRPLECYYCNAPHPIRECPALASLAGASKN